jgi:hypothetical protein
MASNNKISVSVTGKGNSGVVAGGSIGNISTSDSKNDIKVNLGGENNQIQVAGADVIENALEELGKLLIVNFEKRSDKEYIREIVQQLNEQVIKDKNERNEPKVKGLLNNLATYVGFAGFAVSQAEKIKVLYEQVIKFFN